MHGVDPAAASKVYAVAKVRLDGDGRITHVLWGPVDTRRNEWAGPESVVPVDAVVRALNDGHHVYALYPSTHGHLPERRFIVAEYDNGWHTIVLDGPPTHEREVHDMARLDG